MSGHWSAETASIGSSALRTAASRLCDVCGDGFLLGDEVIEDQGALQHAACYWNDELVQL